MTHVKVRGTIVSKSVSFSRYCQPDHVWTLGCESTVELRSLCYSTEWSIIQCFTLECLI